MRYEWNNDVWDLEESRLRTQGLSMLMRMFELTECVAKAPDAWKSQRCQMQKSPFSLCGGSSGWKLTSRYRLKNTQNLANFNLHIRLKFFCNLNLVDPAWSLSTNKSHQFRLKVIFQPKVCWFSSFLVLIVASFQCTFKKCNKCTRKMWKSG